ncbi:Holliday junction resolvase RuvX [Dehalococcoidia bacterium]|nr:Holliday junction resolvase RuvX [Dehalococcoidia bacterium]MCL0081821.1 Holliday junction resolvase RuvX [Dehalococcoidia bacterium]
MVEKNEVGCIVVGLPRSMDGIIGKQAAKVDAFAKELSELTDVPIKMWDERLSTIAADRLLRDAGRDRRKIKKRGDAAAAALILQGYLDRQAFRHQPQHCHASLREACTDRKGVSGDLSLM